MPKPMTREDARAEAQRRADETDEWQIIHISHPDNGDEWYSVLSKADAAIASYELEIVECIRPGDGGRVHIPWRG